MTDLDIQEVFDRLDDADALGRPLCQDENLKIMATKCAKIAAKYDADAVIVGALVAKVIDLTDFKVLFELEEPLYTAEIKGKRTHKDCWIATKSVVDAIQANNAFYLQYLAVVDKDTKQVLALHNGI